MISRYLTDNEKNRKQEYDCKRYKNISEAEKQMLVEYRKRCFEMQKNNCKIAQKVYNF